MRTEQSALPSALGPGGQFHSLRQMKQSALNKKVTGTGNEGSVTKTQSATAVKETAKLKELPPLPSVLGSITSLLQKTESLTSFTQRLSGYRKVLEAILSTLPEPSAELDKALSSFQDVVYKDLASHSSRITAIGSFLRGLQSILTTSSPSPDVPSFRSWLQEQSDLYLNVLNQQAANGKKKPPLPVKQKKQVRFPDEEDKFRQIHEVSWYSHVTPPPFGSETQEEVRIESPKKQRVSAAKPVTPPPAQPDDPNRVKMIEKKIAEAQIKIKTLLSIKTATMKDIATIRKGIEEKKTLAEIQITDQSHTFYNYLAPVYYPEMETLNALMDDLSKGPLSPTLQELRNKLKTERDLFEAELSCTELVFAQQRAVKALMNRPLPSSQKEVEILVSPLLDALDMSRKVIAQRGIRPMGDMSERLTRQIELSTIELRELILDLVIQCKPKQFRVDKRLFQLPLLQTVLLSCKNGQWTAYRLPKDQHYEHSADKGENVLGKGSYGKAVQAERLKTSSLTSLREFIYGNKVPEPVEMIALKKMHLTEKFKPFAAREVESLKEMKGVRGFTQMDGDELVLEGRSGTRGRIDKMYVPLELAEKGDLKQYLSKNPINISTQRGLEVAKRLCAQLLMALEEAHVRGKVLADIKPENILVFEDAQGNLVFKLSDFGLMHQEGDKKVSGTTLYMPNNAFEDKVMTAKNDIFSLGATLWEAIFGTHLFSHSKETATPYHNYMNRMDSEGANTAVRNYKLTDVQWPKNCPSTLKKMLRMMISEDSSKRASAHDLLQEHFVQGTFMTLRRDALTPPFIDWVKEKAVPEAFNHFNGSFNTKNVKEKVKEMIKHILQEKVSSGIYELSEFERRQLLPQLQGWVKTVAKEFIPADGRLMKWIDREVQAQVKRVLKH